MNKEEQLLPVTSIKIKRISNSLTGVLAIISIELADCIAIHGIKLVEIRDRHTKEKKRILAFPNRKLSLEEQANDIKYTDIVHPTNSKYRKYLEDLIFRLYDMGDDFNG